MAVGFVSINFIKIECGFVLGNDELIKLGGLIDCTTGCRNCSFVKIICLFVVLKY